MKKALFVIVILGLTTAALCMGSAYAQTEATKAPVAGEAQDAYGEVVSVDANAGTIIITEYDYEKDQDVNKTYNIDKAATYENVKALNEVKVGDWVALTLKPEKDGSPLASSVYVEKYDLTEGETASPAATPAVPAEAPLEEPAE
jgi:hypothetical protein